jgi:LmbE family N-acetylglucosaminyl deacetylase
MRSKNPNSILAIFAHPDDEAFSVAGTFAKYARLSAVTSLVCATLGQAGTRRHIKKTQDLGRVRERELTECAQLLKVKNLYLLGYHDGQLHKVNKRELQEKIEKIIKGENPKVIITFGPDGVTGHIDHITISKITTAVFKKVCDKKSQRLLYVAPIATNGRKLKPKLPAHLSATGQEFLTVHKKSDVDAIIDITDFWPIKLKAVKCHFSQDDVRAYFRKIKQRPTLQETFILAVGPKFKLKPASDFF